MKQLIAYFIKYPITGNVILVLMGLLGFAGLTSLRSSFFPEVDPRTVTVQVVYPGASPEEMEEGVVLKIEDNLKGVQGVERIKSVSQENSATITVEVLENANPDKVATDVENAVDRINSFPTGIEPPVITRQEYRNFAISFAIYGDLPLKALKDLARDVEDDLRAVDGISQIALSGYPDEEIEISVNEDKLRAYNLSINDVANAVRQANIELTGGKIKTANEELLIRVRSKEYFAHQLHDIVVATTPNGSLVLLHQVANIADTWADNPNRSFFNGKRSVSITIQNTNDEDILFITDHVKNYIDTFNQTHTEAQAGIIRDGSVNLKERIDLLLNNGRFGAFLVLLFLSMFLHPRLAFWVAIGIPVSFLGMFILASMYGLTINVISLFGMVIVIGILVDDGIVIAENIYQHAERGKTPLRAAIDGTMEVMPAIVTAIATTAVAFSVFFFLEGRIGEFITDMAFVVIATLGISLVEGLLILPAHVAHSKALKNTGRPSLPERTTGRALIWLRDKTYAPALRFALKNKALTMAVGIGLLMVTMGLMKGGIVKTTFFPFVERDQVTVRLKMPSGTRDYIVEDWLRQIETAAYRADSNLRANSPDGLGFLDKTELKVGPTINEGLLNVSLEAAEKRSIASFSVANLIRENAPTVPGAENLSFEVNAPFGKPVSVALLGDNMAELEAATQRLKEALNQMENLRDVIDNNQEGLREVSLKLNQKAKMLNLRPADVMRPVREGFFGAEVQRLQRGLDEVRVWVRYEENYRSNIENLRRMQIRLPNGNQYPLEELADISIGRGVIAINHLNSKREIVVEADFANPGESASEINATIEYEILPPILADYPDVSVSFEGQARQFGKTAGSAKKVIWIILAIMLGLVVTTFRSFSQTIAVFLMVFTFGLVGVVAGHLVEGIPISILSIYGIIALIGVLVNDSLVMVTALNTSLRQGFGFDQSVINAGISRFRPIILTSLTTIAGLYPLIYEKSFQAQFLKPMAISLAYGLLVATFFMLIVLPVMLVLVNRLKVMSLWLWTGHKPTPEDVEPAVKEIRQQQAENI